MATRVACQVVLLSWSRWHCWPVPILVQKLYNRLFFSPPSLIAIFIRVNSWITLDNNWRWNINWNRDIFKAKFISNLMALLITIKDTRLHVYTHRHTELVNWNNNSFFCFVTNYYIGKVTSVRLIWPTKLNVQQLSLFTSVRDNRKRQKNDRCNTIRKKSWLQ